MSAKESHGPEYNYNPKEIFEMVAKYVKNIRYGSVAIIVQDGKIVQIEKNEKERFV